MAAADACPGFPKDINAAFNTSTVTSFNIRLVLGFCAGLVPELGCFYGGLVPELGCFDLPVFLS